MADLCAVVADIILWLVFRKLFKQLLGTLEVLFHENFGVVVGALSTFLTESIHVVPAELADNVLKLASFPVEAESHIEVGTALIDMPEGTVLSFFAFFSHKIGTYFQVMAEVTLVSISASPHALEFVAWFYFAFVMRVRAIIRQSTLSVDKFFAYSIGSKFVVVRCGDWLFSCCWSVVKGIKNSGIGALLLLWVHYIIKQIISGLEIGIFGLHTEFSNPFICLSVA